MKKKLLLGLGAVLLVGASCAKVTPNVVQPDQPPPDNAIRADINGDERTDAIYPINFNTLVYQLGEESGGFGTPIVVVTTPYSGFRNLEVADFDLDERPDIRFETTTSLTTSKVYNLTNLGNNERGEPQFREVGNGGSYNRPQKNPLRGLRGQFAMRGYGPKGFPNPALYRR